jgi:hypothetical protein
MRFPLPKKNQYSNICIDEHQGAPLTLVFVFKGKEKDQLSGLVFFCLSRFLYINVNNV